MVQSGYGSSFSVIFFGAANSLCSLPVKMQPTWIALTFSELLSLSCLEPQDGSSF